nr:MAG TPA: hypothetical protein [Caudoviricetes sp.]
MRKKPNGSRARAREPFGARGRKRSKGRKQAIGVFVKRNFLGAGKSYMIKGKQAEKKAENTPCGRLKCVLVAGVNTPYSHAFPRRKGCILFLV